MLNVRDLLVNYGIKPRKASGDELHSHCPGCGSGKGGPSKSDRFQVYPSRNDGRGWFICRKCGVSGDNIQFLREFQSMGYREACQELGIAPKEGEQPGRKLPRTPSVPVQPDQQEFQPEERLAPADIWCDAATTLVIWAHEQLKLNAKAQEWLADRGISMETAEKYQLGWNPGQNEKALYKSRPSWGLPEEKNEKTGRKKPLWLPIGWTVPLLDETGKVIQVRIRRTNEEIGTFLPNMKYRVIPGSSAATMVLNHRAKVFIVVENGLDACLISQETDSTVGAVTTWNAQAKPDKKSTELLRQATAILLAHDFDDAGRKGADWWLKNFDNAIRWPVPHGNDAGDAWAAGVDISAWINEGLPPVCKIKNVGAISHISSGRSNLGGGVEKQSLNNSDVASSLKQVGSVSGLPCGKCGCKNYTFLPGGYEFGDGQAPCDGWKCNECCTVFLLSGNKEADSPYKVKGGIHEDPELLYFIEGLKKHRGFVRISDQGQSMGLGFVEGLTVHNQPERQGLADTLYQGEVVPFLMVLLPDGKYLPATLERWAGRNPKNGYERR